MHFSKGQLEPHAVRSKVAHHGPSKRRDAGCLPRQRISRKEGNRGGNILFMLIFLFLLLGEFP